MASKGIKINLRLAIDGKEQLGFITSSAKDIARSLDEAKKATKRFPDSIYNSSSNLTRATLGVSASMSLCALQIIVIALATIAMFDILIIREIVI